MQQTFKAIIKQREGINGSYIEIPFDVNEVYGAKRVKVVASFDGVIYRGSIVRMDNRYILGIPIAIRNEIGKSFGSEIEVCLKEDLEERKIDIPEDFQDMLDKEPKAQERYNSLSFTAKKDFIRWITDAKKQETRLNRMEKTISLLLEGKKLR